MRRIIYLIVLLFVFPNLAGASRHHHRKRHPHKRILKTDKTFPELRGSKFSMWRQNETADLESLERIDDDRRMVELKLSGDLVFISDVEGMFVDQRLNPDYRWVRPWTKMFLHDTAQVFYKNFRNSFQVNSAVRTVNYQRLLRRHNRNAAELYGDHASSHLTGATIDIAKHNLNRNELVWFRKYLVDLERGGLIEATEEFHQAVFHVMVFKKYSNL